MEGNIAVSQLAIPPSQPDTVDPKRRTGTVLIVLLSPAMIWLMIFLVLPLLIMLVYSFGTMTGASMSLFTEFTTDNFLRLIENPLYHKVAFNSIKLSLIVVVLAILIGYPTAYWLTLRSETTKFVFLCLMLVPFWTSALLRTYSWILILQGKGAVNVALMKLHLIDSPLNILWTQNAVIIATLQIYLPFMVIPLFAVLEMHDWKLVEAANNLGANKFRAFFEITLPLSMPGLLVGVIFVFIPVIGEYLIPIMLSGTSFPVVSEVIASNFGNTFNWPLGCAYAVIISALICLAVFGLLRIAPPWKLLQK